MFKTTRTPFAWLLLSASLFPVAAHAQEKQVNIQAIGTLQYIVEEDPDLGTGTAGTEDSLSEQLAVRAGVDFTDEWFALFHGRALNIDGESGFDDDTGATINDGADETFAELRELYVLKRNLFGATPWSLQVGRQRVREPRALWWNSDNDLVRFNYDTTLLKGFVAAGEDMRSYRTGTHSDFRHDDEDRFRVFGESSYQYTMGHFIEGRLLYEDDHSGMEAPGTIIDAGDRDNEDQNLLWAGVRATGNAENAVPSIASLKYRADLMGVFGEEDNLTSVAGPGAETRTVTGSDNRDVSAWGFDGGVVLDPGVLGGPVGMLGYAYGSGDNGTGSDSEFRQTDIQGNSSRTGLERQQQKNYGEVFRPELSNIHVLNAGLGVPVTQASDVALSYFYYRLDEDATGLRSSGISAPLNGNDKDLGQELDIAFNVDVDEQFNLQPNLIEGINFRLVTGGFFPGDAYEPTGDDTAYRIFTELQFRF